jgi:secreted trypsin-like serine protease
LISKNGNTQLCGGTFVSSEWILTAYHCIKDFSPSNLQISAGVKNGKLNAGSDSSVPTRVSVNKRRNNYSGNNLKFVLKCCEKTSVNKF